MAQAPHRSTPAARRGRVRVAALALVLALTAGLPACRGLVRPVVSQEVELVRTECLYCARLDATWLLLVAGHARRASELWAELRWLAAPGSPHQLLARDLHLLGHALDHVEAGRVEVAELCLASMGSPALAPLRRRMLAALRSRAAPDLATGLVQGQCAPSRLEVCAPRAWPPLGLAGLGPDGLPRPRRSP